ncbi:MAG TPA: DUF4019 domain-containing protein [Thermoanaerobaculia bacterium]|nr:DUF4019 domain-containing protein [Thermoanaerobaculia bacterium]
MNPGKLLATAVAFVLLCTLGTGQSQAEDKETAARDAARKAAEAWLAKVDSGAYAASWDEAAASFKLAIKKEAWVTTLEQVRKPLGAVQSRVFKSAQYKTDLPGAPKGEYVILQFDTGFANRAGSTETVTPVLEEGGWRVTGYFIK